MRKQETIMYPELLKLIILIVTFLFPGSALASLQMFTVDGITFEYSFDENGSNENLSVVDWESSIIDLVIPEGINLPDSINAPDADEGDVSRAENHRYVSISKFEPKGGGVPMIESISFLGPRICIICDFSSFPRLRQVSLSPDTEIIPAGFLKGCKNIKTYEIGSKVKEIGAFAFAESGIEKIYIPASVRNMGEYCFSGCENLTEVVFGSPEDQKSYSDFVLHNHQFQNCSSLKTIVIGAGIAEIDPTVVFDGCDAVTEFVLASGVDEIFFGGNYSGEDCVFMKSPLKRVVINRNYDSCVREIITNDHFKPSPFSWHPTLEEVEIGGMTTRLNMEAFKGCPNLAKIDFKVPLDSIGNGSFSKLPSLKSLELPDGIEKLSGHLFEDSENLVDLKIPTTVKEICEYAFCHCKSLPNLTLHEGVEKLGIASFDGCTSFTEFTFPNSLKECEWHAFKDCVNLSKVVVGTGLDILYSECFYGCPVLCELIFADGNEYWQLSGGFQGTPIKYLYLGRNHFYNTQYYTYQPFCGCHTLSRVKFGNQITEIQWHAFLDCVNLAEVEFGNNIETIGGYAFYDNKSLKTITLPSSLKQIEEQAFRNCDSLLEITLPEHLERIGDFVFGSWSDEFDQKKIKSLNLVPPICGENAFSTQIYQKSTLYVPKVALDVYKSTFPWSMFNNIFTIEDAGVDVIKTDGVTDGIDYTLPYEVFSLGGIKVGNNVNGISDGLYIIRQGHIVKKVAINL